MGPAGDRAGNHDSLSLSAGQRVHALWDRGMHAHRHALDVGIETGKPRGLPRVLERQLDAAANIVVEAACRQFSILQYHAKLPPYRADVERVERLSIEEHRAGLRPFEAQ